MAALVASRWPAMKPAITQIPTAKSRIGNNLIKISSQTKTNEDQSEEQHVGRRVVYSSSSDALTGSLAGWNCRFAFVQFHAQNWTDYPRISGYVCTAVFPEHLSFDRSRGKA